MTTDLCCGAEVSSHKGDMLLPAYVRLEVYHPLRLTPDEAERLAELLVKHAREARGK